MSNLFPDTAWNRYVVEANKKIFDLESDSKAQEIQIRHTVNDMLKKHFEYKSIYKWVRSMLMLTKNEDRLFLYDYLNLVF